MVELDSLDSSPTREDMEFSDPKVGRLLLCVDKRAAFKIDRLVVSHSFLLFGPKSSWS